MNYCFFFIPLLSALIGWISIRLFLTVIFRPHLPHRFFFLTWQGFLPRYRQSIAIKIGKYVAGEFAGMPGIDQKVADPKNFEKVRPMIETHIDDFLRNKLKEQMPMIGMFIGDKTIVTLKAIFLQEIEDLFPQVMQQFANNLKNEIDLEILVTSKLAAVSTDQVEKLVYENARKPLQLAAVLGAAIGFLIGLIQLAIVWYTN